MKTNKSSFLKVFYYTAIIFLAACHQEQSQNNKSHSYSKGRVIEKMICKKSASQNYSLYLPSSYHPDKAWPVIFFFDAHARGVLPLSKYKQLADKYGYILAGSNNLQNQQVWDEIKYSAQILLDDVTTRFNIDKRRIYASGFSGGARVASSLALLGGNFAGIISCAAGFPQSNDKPKYMFTWFGIVGNEDFNYLEMKNSELYLGNSPLKHQLVIFEGKHDWPPQDIMEEAFLWLEVNAFKEKYEQTNDSLLFSIRKKFEAQISLYEDEHDHVARFIALNKTINFLDGLHDISSYRKYLAVMEISKEYQNEKGSETIIENREYSKQEEYRNAFSAKKVNWWKNEIDGLFNLEKSKDHKISLMAKRLINYISLIAYMNASGALNAMNNNATEQYLQIYKMADPENPDFHYLTACFFAKQNKLQEALNSLAKATDYGFADIDKAKEDNNLRSLQNHEEFLLLLKKIETNQAGKQ